MRNAITFEDVKQSEYPQENISRYVESRRLTINEWLYKEKYQIDIPRFKRYGFLWLKKQPINPFIQINLFDMIGRDSIYYDSLDLHEKKAWLNKICGEIQKQYEGWNIEYKIKDVDAKYECYWTCQLYFKKQ